MNKHKIADALVNAGIAAGLIFFGAFTSGHVSAEAILAAFAAAMIVGLSRFRDDLGLNKKGCSIQLFKLI